MASTIQKFGISTAIFFATSESVISKDFVKAEELLDNAIKKLIGTDPIAVGVDGTSMRHKKIQIVVLHTL